VPEPDVSPEQVEATIQSRAFIVLMLVAAIAGVVVSLAAWCFLELLNQIQRGVFVHLPSDLGYHGGPPLWWSLPVLALAGLITAFAIERLPGSGGHIPAAGLSIGGGPTLPIDLPGVILAALATIGLGIVLGPEAPLIALGSGLGDLTIRLARSNAPPQVVTVLAAAGTFAAVSFLFQSPLLAAVLMVEVTGLGGPKLTLVLLPGLLAAGIGGLVSLGMGSWTGLSTSAYALGSVEGLAKFARPDIADFGWTIALAIAVALVCVLMVRSGRQVVSVVARRRFVLLPAVGLIVAGLAIAFQQSTGKPFQEVLFSGQDSIPQLLTKASTWSIGALALLIVFKGIAYSLSLGSFRGGPTFPALFLGAVAGLTAGQLPGYSITPAIAVGMAAAIAAVLRLPLSAIVIAAVLTAGSGAGSEPLVIVGAIVAYMISRTVLPPPAMAVPTAAKP
jgi:H+/Cl- antiporter ClcA